jgi:hypothetical protein
MRGFDGYQAKVRPEIRVPFIHLLLPATAPLRRKRIAAKVSLSGMLLLVERFHPKSLPTFSHHKSLYLLSAATQGKVDGAFSVTNKNDS